jgi:hypothetical protein
MVTQDEHGVYPGSGREQRNTLRPASLWIVLMYDEMFFEGGPCPPYIVRGQGYRSKESNPSRLQLLYHGGYDIYPNRLGFLDCQVVSACSARFAEQFGDPCGPF